MPVGEVTLPSDSPLADSTTGVAIYRFSELDTGGYRLAVAVLQAQPCCGGFKKIICIPSHLLPPTVLGTCCLGHRHRNLFCRFSLKKPCLRCVAHKITKRVIPTLMLRFRPIFASHPYDGGSVPKMTKNRPPQNSTMTESIKYADFLGRSVQETFCTSPMLPAGPFRGVSGYSRRFRHAGAARFGWGFRVFDVFRPRVPVGLAPRCCVFDVFRPRVPVGLAPRFS